MMNTIGVSEGIALHLVFYWARHMEVARRVFGGVEIPEAVFTNVDWLHRPRDPEMVAHVDDRVCRHITALLDMAIAAGPVRLAPHSLEVDDRLGQKPGTSLLVARHLLANGRYAFDVTKPIDPDDPFQFERTAAQAAAPLAEVAQALCQCRW